jgi:hypothetical protein
MKTWREGGCIQASGAEFTPQTPQRRTPCNLYPHALPFSPNCSRKISPAQVKHPNLARLRKHKIRTVRYDTFLPSIQQRVGALSHTPLNSNSNSNTTKIRENVLQRVNSYFPDISPSEFVSCRNHGPALPPRPRGHRVLLPGEVRLQS